VKRDSLRVAARSSPQGFAPRSYAGVTRRSDRGVRRGGILRGMTTSARLLAILVLSWIPSSASLASPQASSQERPRAPQAGALEIGDPYFPGLGNGGYDVEHYALELAIDMDSNEVAATARIRARALLDLASFSFDLYGLEVEGVRVEGQDARFERTPPAQLSDGTSGKSAELVIRPAAPLAAGVVFTTEVAYRGTPAGRPDPAFAFLPQSKGSGWMRRESGVYVTSQCIGAASWFPCNDHPRDKASYSFRITVAKPWTVAANGVLTEVLEQADARTFVFEARDPMASYLATLNVAKFGVLESKGPRCIPMRIYHPLDATDGDLAGFRRQGEVLEFLESVFGPYPFEAAGGVMQSEPAAGALECQTLPVYGRGCDLETILHELAHQWFGDSVSVDLWRDLWLNEAFASYSEWLWLEDTKGVEAYDQKARRTYAELRKKKTGSPFDPGVAQAFSGRVYERGPFVLHGLRHEVGDEDFFRILKGWVEANKNGNVSTSAFVAYASKCAGRDLAPFFDAWLFADVTPEVKELEPQHRANGAGG
jgi:aminopeptidase N